MQISCQTILTIFCTNKLNLRLVKILQYLSSFSLFIYYKSNKLNIVFDALSRLQSNVLLFEKIKILKLLYDYFIQLYKSDLAIRISEILLKQTLIYYITLIEITNNLKYRLKTIYVNDHY